MPSITALLFGDQTAEVLPSIERLNAHGLYSPALRSFFRNSTDRLRAAIARLPSSYRRQFPASFESPLELARWAASPAPGDEKDAGLLLRKISPALSAALLCIAQLGHVIVELEANPRRLERSTADDATVMLGTCTGLLTTIAVGCSHNLSDLLAIADEVVVLAFHVGFEGVRRTAVIDDSPASHTTSATWATLVTNIAEISVIEAALAKFNSSHVLAADRQVYISSSLSSSSSSVVTLSGPPAVTAAFFDAHASAFQGTKRIPLPIAAAFHAPHLSPVFVEHILEKTFEGRFSETAVSGRTMRSDVALLAASSGRQRYDSKTFVDIFADVVYDIFQAPIDLGAAMHQLAKKANHIAAGVILVSFGPINSTKAIARYIEAKKIPVECQADPSSSTSSVPSPSISGPLHPPPPGDNAIAIVGMASRLPGSETLEEFWQVLEQGRDLHEPIRPDRFNVNTHCDPTGQRRNTTLTPYGVFIDRPGFFDTRLFRMSPREAAQTDPGQRLLLLTTYEALEMAGYALGRTPSSSPRRIGSFVGQTGDDYREVNAGQDVDTYFVTGGIRAFGPGRLNYHFGWEGPSYSVDTACSSSAASIQLACTSLLARDCDTAVAGGANLLTTSDFFAGLSRGSFLSKTGGCKTFDADADGYVRGDAVAVIVLKRLADAVADNDNILAVIRSAVTNHSAEAISITHPHAATQERLFQSALDRAGLQPNDIDYAELHGTGTQAGDATESKSVTNVLARNRGPAEPLYVGSVKPNLGHGEAASGVTSLMKVIMMMRNNAIPPHVGIKGKINPKLAHLKDLNTHIAFKTTPFIPRPGGDGKRRILINNFDAAGGNTSIVMEDAPLNTAHDHAASDPRSHHIVAVSGRTATALANNSQRLLNYLRSDAVTSLRLEDLAYTTTARRMHHGLRQTHVVSSLKGLVSSLESSVQAQSGDAKTAKAPSKSLLAPPLVFCFTGQGSQYAGMASELFDTHSSFRESILACDRIAIGHGFESFLPLISGQNVDDASPVQVQLAIVSIELSLASLWKSLGVIPAAVMGHSLGEYAALCTAGVLSLSDCLCLVGNRARLMLNNCKPGTQSMLAMSCSVADAENLLRSSPVFSQCEIACANGPTATVVSGPAADIIELQAAASTTKSSIKTTLLDVQFAFHSAQMDAVVDGFASVTAKAHYSTPSIPFASTLLGTVICPGTSSNVAIDSTYLVRQMRERVRYEDALQSLLGEASLKADQAVWIETGPNPICIGLARSTFVMLGTSKASKAPVLLPSLKRGESDWKIFSQAVARTYEAGVGIDWQEFHSAFEPSLHLLELPTYAFDLKNYWIQYRGDWALRKGDPAVPEAPSVEPLVETKAIAAAASYPEFTPTTGVHRIQSQAIGDGSIAVTFTTDAIEPKLNKALRGHLVNGAGLCPSSVLGDIALTAADYIRRLSHLPSSQSITGISPIGLDLCMDVHTMGIHKPLLVQPGKTCQIILAAASWDASSSVVSVTFSSQDGPNGDKVEHAHCHVSFSDGNAWKSLWKRNAHLVRSRMDHLVEASSCGQAHKLLRPMVYKLFASFVDYAPKYQGLEEVYMDSQRLEAAAKVRFLTNEAEDGTFTCSPYWIDGVAHLSGFILNGADTTPADSVFISHGWGSFKFSTQLSADKSYRSYVRMQEETGSRGVFAGDVYFFDGDEVVAMCEDLKFQRVKRSILPYLLPSGIEPANTSSSVMKAKAVVPPAKCITSSKAPVGKAAPRKATGSQASVTVFSQILDIIASEVGINVSELTDDAWFADLGVDSLLAISITAKLSGLLECQLPATLFTKHLGVSQLRGYFAKKDVESNKVPVSPASVFPPGIISDNKASWATPPPSDQDSDDDENCSGTPSLAGTPASSIGQTPSPDAAKDHSTALFRKIIAAEVGVDPSEIEDDTPLADLGVDSLLSLSILGTIKAQTGRILPSSFLLDHATLNDIQNVLGGQSHTSPQELAQAVAKAASLGKKAVETTHTAEAILLQDGIVPSSPALFLLPDGSGSASSYVGLPSMGLNGAVYGLNSPFLSNPDGFTASLHDMASMYVSEIRRMQPHGPYHLGGWSIGGSYAFEVASQLSLRHGQVVNSLILIDAPCPKSLPPLPAETIDLLDTIGAFDGLKGRANKMRSGVRQHFAGSVNALKQYTPAPIPQWAIPRSVTVIWARDGVWETVGEVVQGQYQGKRGDKAEVNAAQDWIMDPRKDKGPNGWESLLPSAKIACQVVPGDHFTIMRRPGITDLGRVVGCSVSE
ncbi:Type I Iterative PKS [Sporothrix bragantina]|uniref:Type I Iterative PKS n=1 Tax=Sporothrix bragantina TaxID=671064 RepID=A0ABP0CF63_9PEZI